MRIASFFAIVFCLAGCQATPQTASQSTPHTTRPSPEAQLIESTILWNAKVDAVTWEPIELKKMLADKKRFTPAGNFYRSNDNITAFGHKVLYIGTLGIDLVSGPNVTLEGNPRSIAAFIAKEHNISFSENDGEYTADIKKNIKMVVSPHPNLKNTSIVIGAYLGP
ncbi:MAG: hypothetical protein V1809_02075 [Planctomycetota bacterium]